jgi:hypothetical protein
MPLDWRIDECAGYFDRVRLRGWCFNSSHAILKVDAVFPEPETIVPLKSFGQPSPDVAASLGANAANCRFEEWVEAPAEAVGRDFSLRFHLADGTAVMGGSVVANALIGDPFFRCWDHFVDRLAALPAGAVLEIGSRARSTYSRRHLIPKQLEYVGLDIHAGPNVDVVGDAHALEQLFGRNRFVAVYSLSVFEHLAMPWKVALELNRVLAPGGLVFTQTHQTWPIHEEPWDFWRFTRFAWQPLFNAATGFEILDAVVGEPARIHPYRTTSVTRLMPESPGYLGSASLVRKISDTTLSWDVPLSVAAAANYPAGELSNPPS